jgi:hypothetical protein
MLIKLKHVRTLVESLKRRLVLEGLKDDIKNSLITLVGLEESNNIFNQLTISNSRLNQIVSQDPNYHKDSRLAELIKDSKKFDGEQFIINLRDNGIRAIEDFKKWYHELMSIPSSRDMRSHLSSYAKFGTIKKELTNPQGEKFNVYFKLTPSASIKLARDLGGSKMCTTSDKSCKNWNVYSKSEYSGKNPLVTILVTFQPIDESLVDKALRLKHETHGHMLKDQDLDLNLQDFERSLSMQAVLNAGRIQKKEVKALDYDEASFYSEDEIAALNSESGKLYLVPREAEYDDIGWYDDLMYSYRKGSKELEKLYGVTPASLISLLNQSDLEKILYFKQTSTGASSPKDNDRTPMEKWIESFPGKRVTKLPPPGFPIDDVRPEFGKWSFRDIEFDIDVHEDYEKIDFENCTFVSKSGKTFGIAFLNCHVKNCVFDGAHNIEFSKNSYVEKSVFRNMRDSFSINGIGGYSSAENLIFESCTFKSGFSALDCQMIKLVFKNCYFENFDAEKNTDVINFSFENCEFKDLNLDGDNINALKEFKVSGGTIKEMGLFDLELEQITISNVVPPEIIRSGGNRGKIKINGKLYKQSGNSLIETF